MDNPRIIERENMNYDIEIITVIPRAYMLKTKHWRIRVLFWLIGIWWHTFKKPMGTMGIRYEVKV